MAEKQSKRVRETLAAGDERLALRCPACLEQLAEGDAVIGVPIGPGRDPKARKAAREGEAFKPVFAIAHDACVTGHED